MGTDRRLPVILVSAYAEELVGHIVEGCVGQGQAKDEACANKVENEYRATNYPNDKKVRARDLKKD